MPTGKPQRTPHDTVPSWHNTRPPSGIPTSGVVPHAVVGQLHGVGVLRLLKVLVGVAADVAAAADVPADQADPQVLRAEDGGGG